MQSLNPQESQFHPKHYWILSLYRILIVSSRVVLVHLGISDHDLIYTVRKQKLPKSKARITEFRSFKNFDEEAFLSDLRAVPWDIAYVFDEIDEIWSHWVNLFMNVVDIHAPIKCRSLRNNNLPWIDWSIQRQIRIRNRLYKLFRRLPTNENWIAYKSQRNKVTALKRRAVKDFCVVAASNSSNNSSGLFWKRMRPLLPNTKLTDNSNTIHLIEGGAFLPDPGALFNKYFTTPSIAVRLLQLSVDDFMNHPSFSAIRNSAQKLDFSFEPVSIPRVAESLVNLNSRKSAGPDGLSPKLLKLLVPVIAVPLTKLFNRCIISSVWPSQWKLSNVTPVYMNEDEKSKSSYRPISVLSTIPKVFEKLKFDQLYRHFLPLFSDNMSGFLRGHSCCTALLKLTEDWRLALNS